MFTCTPTQLGSITSRCSRKEPILLYRTHFSLLTSHFSLLTSHFSPLTSHFSLRTSHFSLLTSHFSGRNLVKPNSSKRRKSSRSTTVSMICELLTFLFRINRYFFLCSMRSTWRQPRWIEWILLKSQFS